MSRSETMTQQAFKSRAGGVSQCEMILAKLTIYAGQWVPMPDLWLISGSLNVHSRISDLRRRGHNIEQRNSYEGKRVIKSFYKLILKAEAA